MNWVRRALLELWGMSVLAFIVGFLGPFGSYIGNHLIYRVQAWSGLLLGAYVFVRPLIWGLDHIARRTALPTSALAFWGVAAMSAPLAMLWRAVGQDAFRAVNGYALLVPFALLCSLTVLGVARWAQNTSKRLTSPLPDPMSAPAPDEQQDAMVSRYTAELGEVRPRLLKRLSAAFQLPIIALQSEDHYVRVHGLNGGELVLMRLRDAIAEMDGIAGEQVHRSWWIARDGIKDLAKVGRTWNARLTNGELAPVARESVERLRHSGFLPDAIDSLT